MKPGEIIRYWRKIRDRRQADVAAGAGISVRHLSFVETGRTKPSVETLKAIANSIIMPRSEYDKLMLAAGYAPEDSATPYVTDDYAKSLQEPLSVRAQTVTEKILSGYGASPVVAVDEAWDVIGENKAHSFLINAIVSPADQDKFRSKNFMHLFFHPLGLGGKIVEWPHLSAMLMLMLRKQAVGKHYDHPVHKLIDEVSVWARDEDGKEILEPYELSAVAASIEFAVANKQKYSFLLTTLGFAAPYSPAMQGRRFGVYFPGDAQTATWLQKLGG